MNEPANPEVEILNTALELRPGERSAYLDQACAGNARLRQRVEELLQAHGQAENFLAASPAGHDFKRTMLLNIIPTEKPGDKIGRYKLLQQIGEGGCGVVYMAEQEEPVRRRVALKVIKLGMDTKEVIARFEAERQALALMDHPNIAKVLDAGATRTGRPYFVMELVRGIKITEFCDEGKVSTADRLKLFIQVCQAIQHAHQKGIIHRDIKPSNILITVNDGVPVPKVIDFGIAKATAGRLTDKTLFTAFEQFIGTPAYMSPEQAVMTSLDIDTRSDIYSLGVLLYELLTGKTPFDANELIQSGLDAIRRTIREIEPPKPSTRLSTMLDAERTVTATCRQTDPPKLIHLVRGDLDWIVMKSLEKDRTRRYETANGLAADIQRHLNNEPVNACPPSALYRFQKIVRRNKLICSAAGAVVLALVVGLGISTWLWHEAVIARGKEAGLRRKAEAQATIAQARTLFDGGQIDEAERLLNGIDASLIEPDATHAAVRRGLAWRHARENLWNSSVANLRVLLQVDGLGDDEEVAGDYLLYTAALLELGDRAGYESVRQSALVRFAKVTDPVAAESVCKAVSLMPIGKNMGTSLDRFYDLATSRKKYDYFDEGDTRDPVCWNRISRALVDYRRGNFVQAAELCRQCLSLARGDKARVPTALLISAMARYQLHQDNDACLELAYARETVDSVLQSGSPGREVFHGRWFEWFDASILLREATAMMGDRRSPAFGTPAEIKQKIKNAGSLCFRMKFAEAEKLVSGLPAVAIEINDRDARLVFASLGWWHVCEHRWTRAADCWRVVLNGPNEEGGLMVGREWDQLCLSYAPLVIELGDKAAYERLLGDSAGHHAYDLNIAEMVLTTCLLYPGDAAPRRNFSRGIDEDTGQYFPSDLSFDQKMKQIADVVTNGIATMPNWAVWGNAAFALFEYRRTNYSHVLNLMQTNLSFTRGTPTLNARSHILSAMALYRLSRIDEAKAELAQCRDVIENHFNGQLDETGKYPSIAKRTPIELLQEQVSNLGGDRSNTWFDWWIDHVLLGEAETLIQGKPAAVAGEKPLSH